jgi:hypothetical protein
VAKQLLYLSDWDLSAYQQERGGLKRLRLFVDDFEGRRDFATLMRDCGNQATYLLADMAEEDFQHEALPHVGGRARRALTARRLQQYYHGTPYRRAEAQGREAGGQRKDRVLFSALTNPAIPKSWLQLMAQYQVPLAGLYSLALLTEPLRKRLRLPAAASLLITHLSSGLRQSYFHEGHLLFSRLTPLFEGDPALFSDAVQREIAKTRDFLASTRQLLRTDLLHVAVLASSANLAPLQVACTDNPVTRYRLITLDEAVGLLRLTLAEPPLVCDPLFLGLLAKLAPAPHYPTPEQTRVYTLWRARFALHALSALAVAGAFVWTGVNALAGWDQYQSMRQIGSETEAANAEYRKVVREMPVSDVGARDMKLAVEMGKLLRQNGASPAPIIHRLSGALAALPSVSIARLHWLAREFTAGPDVAPAPAQADAPPSAALVGLPHKAEQVLTIEGAVKPFRGDFRRALRDVHQFAELLGGDPAYRVEIKRLPIDIRPVATLEGEAADGATDAKAEFELKLIWKP